nr:MAG TPA: hypothetical protein [Bacteriophage sp.]
MKIRYRYSISSPKLTRIFYTSTISTSSSTSILFIYGNYYTMSSNI